MTLRRFARAGVIAMLVGGWIPVRAQLPGDVNPLQLDLAGLREDVRLLSQRVGELSIAVEQLQRENNALRGKAAQSASAGASLAQLNQAVAELNRSMKAALAEQRSDILDQVGAQMEKLARQTNAALDGLGKGTAPAPAPAKPAVFTEDFPKEGITYAVQRGDTLAEIARKNGANVRDIINANKIADPARIQAGQALFIPKGKN
jgi:LysM repeat protein